MQRQLSLPSGATAEDGAARAAREFEVPEGRVNPVGWRTAAAGRGSEPEAPRRDPASLRGAPGQRQSCWELRQQIHPAREPRRAADASAGQTIPILPPGPGIRSVPAAARQLPTHPTHRHTHTNTQAQAHTATHTHKPSWPEKPQEPAAMGSPSVSEEERGAGRAGSPGSSSRIPAGKAPPEAKKQSELQGNADSNAEISPHPRLKNLFPQLEEEEKNNSNKKKSRNKSANQARRAVSVAQGSGWTGQESEGVPRARQRKADDGLQVAFGARFASGMQRELAAPAPASTLPRNGSPRRRRESER